MVKDIQKEIKSDNDWDIDKISDLDNNGWATNIYIGIKGKGETVLDLKTFNMAIMDYLNDYNGFDLNNRVNKVIVNQFLGISGLQVLNEIIKGSIEQDNLKWFKALNEHIFENNSVEQRFELQEKMGTFFYDYFMCEDEVCDKLIYNYNRKALLSKDLENLKENYYELRNNIDFKLKNEIRSVENDELEDILSDFKDCLYESLGESVTAPKPKSLKF